MDAEARVCAVGGEDPGVWFGSVRSKEGDMGGEGVRRRRGRSVGGGGGRVGGGRDMLTGMVYKHNLPP